MERTGGASASFSAQNRGKRGGKFPRIRPVWLRWPRGATGRHGLGRSGRGNRRAASGALRGPRGASGPKPTGLFRAEAGRQPDPATAVRENAGRCGERTALVARAGRAPASRRRTRAAGLALRGGVAPRMAGLGAHLGRGDPEVGKCRGRGTCLARRALRSSRRGFLNRDLQSRERRRLFGGRGRLGTCSN